MPEEIMQEVGDWSEWAHCLSKPKFVFNKHSSSVNHFDFSLDGRFFQSNCQAAELLFGELGLENCSPPSVAGKQVTSATTMAEYNGVPDADQEDKVWATQTCVLGWPVQVGTHTYTIATTLKTNIIVLFFSFFVFFFFFSVFIFVSSLSFFVSSFYREFGPLVLTPRTSTRATNTSGASYSPLPTTLDRLVVGIDLCRALRRNCSGHTILL